MTILPKFFQIANLKNGGAEEKDSAQTVNNSQEQHLYFIYKKYKYPCNLAYAIYGIICELHKHCQMIYERCT